MGVGDSETGLQSGLITRSHKEAHSSETGKLCIESCSSVFVLVMAPISALIGQNDCKPNDWLHRHHVNACTFLGRTDELRSSQYLWQSTSSVGVNPDSWVQQWVRVHKARVRVRVRVHQARVRVHQVWVRVHWTRVRVQSLGQSPSPSPTKVRVSPDLSSYSAWTHESNSRKEFYCNPTLVS